MNFSVVSSFRPLARPRLQRQRHCDAPDEHRAEDAGGQPLQRFPPAIATSKIDTLLLPLSLDSSTGTAYTASVARMGRAGSKETGTMITENAIYRLEEQCGPTEYIAVRSENEDFPGWSFYSRTDWESADAPSYWTDETDALAAGYAYVLQCSSGPSRYVLTDMVPTGKQIGDEGEWET